MSECDFDWHDDTCIVVHDQGAIAVFKNPRGNIVIRQRDIYDYDGDDWVEITHESVPAVVKALCLEAGFEVVDNATKRKPRDRTAAERQRRYRKRQRLRNGADRNDEALRNGEARDGKSDALPLITDDG